MTQAISLSHPVMRRTTHASVRSTHALDVRLGRGGPFRISGHHARWIWSVGIEARTGSAACMLGRSVWKELGAFVEWKISG